MNAIPATHTDHFSLVVTEAMTVDFEQDTPGLGRLHPVYATYWLTKHVELVSRKLVFPFLDATEESIGFEVRVRHLASALPGMRVTLSATHLRSEQHGAKGRRVYLLCEAFSELGDKIGEGETTQVVMRKETLERKVGDLRRRWSQYRA